jgi:MSHA biogenesis protein MshP
VTGNESEQDAGQRVLRLSSAPSRVSSAGFSLVAALFLIVVVAALGAFAVRIGANQQQTTNLSLLTTRALSAANSGIEFGAYQALYASSCVSVTLNLAEAGLTGFTVNVTCASTPHTESGVAINVYRIDATATLGAYGMPDYVSRHVYATFSSVN